ncbi:MAG: hypothetical protein ACYSUF_01665 [Planctomycetota bacterium]|jgi:hypothetical protein
MSDLLESWNEHRDRLMSARRLMLRHGGDGLNVTRDPAAIVSPVPDVDIDAGQDRFAGRRTRIRLERGDEHVTLLARHRPLPEAPGRPWMLVQWGTKGARHRRIPVSCVDGRTRTVHLLVDLSTASVPDGNGPDAAGLLVEALLDEPVQALLADEGEPSVGSKVARQIRALLADRALHDRDILKKEILRLEGFRSVSGLLPTLSRRLETMRDALRAPRSRKIPEQDVLLEILRLKQLVASRTCAGLCFDRGEISGLLNPRSLGRCQLRPIMFRLRLHRADLRQGLNFWDPQKPARAGRHSVCLGAADFVLRKLYHAGDLYGMVDTVLNFVETNRIGQMPFFRYI